MGTFGGPNITSNGLVFGYDTGYPLVSDNHESYKYFKGQPTETFNVGDMTPSSPNLFYSSSYESGLLNLNGTLWDWYVYPNTNVSTEGGMEWHPNVQGPGFTGAWLMKKRPGGNSESNFQGNPPGVIEETASYTVSVWCKTDQASCFRIHTNVTQNGSSYWGYSSTYHSGGGTWERLSVTIPADSGNTSINTIRCQGIGTTVTADAYFRNYQVEKNPHPTPFILGGTRSVSGSLIDLTRTTDIDLTNVSFDSNAQMTFDGTDDYLSIASSNTITDYSQPFTMECVFMVDPAATWDNGYRSNIFSIDGSYAGMYGLFKYNNTDVGIQLRDADSTTYAVAVNLSKGVYYHLVGTSNGSGTVSLYLNGTLTQDNTGTLTGAPDSQNLFIGGARAFGGAYGNHYQGEIPLTKYYNRALSAQEVKQNYNALKGRFGL